MDTFNQFVESEFGVTEEHGIRANNNIDDSCSANEPHQERHGRESSKRFPDHPAARIETKNENQRKATRNVLNEVFDCDCGANGDNGGLGGTSCVEEYLGNEASEVQEHNAVGGQFCNIAGKFGNPKRDFRDWQQSLNNFQLEGYRTADALVDASNIIDLEFSSGFDTDEEPGVISFRQSQYWKHIVSSRRRLYNHYKEIQRIRIAYEAYEDNDSKGLKLENVDQQSNNVERDGSFMNSEHDSESEYESAIDISEDNANDSCSQFETFRTCERTTSNADDDCLELVYNSHFPNDLLQLESRTYNQHLEVQSNSVGHDNSSMELSESEYESTIDFPEDCVNNCCCQSETYRIGDQTTKTYDDELQLDNNGDVPMKSIYQITSYEELDNCSIFEYKNYALEDFYSDLLELESFRQRWYQHINEQSNSIGYDDSSVEYESETELANDITTNGANNCCSQFETYRKCDMSRTLAYDEDVPMLPESEFGNISCENMENLSLFQIENYSPEDFRTDLLEFENSGRQRLYRYFEDKTSFSGQDDSEPEIDFPENLASCSQFETFRKYDQTSTSYDAIVSASMNASNIDHKIHYYSDVTDNGDDTMESESDSNNDSRLECDYDGDIEECDDEDNF